MVFKTWKVPQTPQVSKYASCQDVAHALVQLSTAQKVVGATLHGPGAKDSLMLLQNREDMFTI
jgi:hypothetical protein